jgi:hypothetical protein
MSWQDNAIPADDSSGSDWQKRATPVDKSSIYPDFVKKAAANYSSFMGPEGGYGSNPAGKLMSLVQKPFNKAGEAAATGLAKKGVNPYLSAGVGTAIQMAPDVALTAAPQGPGADLNVKPTPPTGVLNQLESASGAMPGSLSEQFKNPLLMFKKGTSAAKPLYQAAQAELPYEQTIFKGLTTPQSIVDKAVNAVETGAKLEPQEGLIARKALDKLNKKISPDAFSYYRKVFDGLAKSSEDIAAADPLHKQGMMAQSLRQILPQNKLGGASPFKVAVGKALGVASAPVLSPAVQGLGVGAAGALAQTDPRLITAFMDWYNSLKKKGQGDNQ